MGLSPGPSVSGHDTHRSTATLLALLAPQTAAAKFDEAKDRKMIRDKVLLPLGFADS
jgi:hypothetical protein